MESQVERQFAHDGSKTENELREDCLDMDTAVDYQPIEVLE
jgi:hypothetical protein